jgi:hypothetical protein
MSIIKILKTSDNSLLVEIKKNEHLNALSEEELNNLKAIKYVLNEDGSESETIEGYNFNSSYFFEFDFYVVKIKLK